MFEAVRPSWCSIGDLPAVKPAPAKVFRRLRLTFKVAGLLLSCLADIYVPCAHAQYTYTHWTVADGLPQNEIRGIAQTSDGFIWIATLDGLSRFDGLRFTTFTRTNSPGIRSNRLTGLYRDSKGDLWAPYERDGVLHYHQGEFESFDTAAGLADETVSTVWGDNLGNVWVLSGRQIQIWNDQTQHFDNVPWGRGHHFSPLTWGMGAESSAYDDGIHSATDSGLGFYPFPKYFPKERLRAVAVEDQTTWLDTADGRLYRLSRSGASAVFSDHGRKGVQLEGVDGQQWQAYLGPYLSRSVVIDMAGKRFTLTFKVAFPDRQGNLWLGTESSGLYCLRRKNISVITAEHGLIDRDVYPIYQDKSGAVWIGAWYKGLSRFYKGRLKNFAAPPGLPSWRVTSLLEDREGKLWVASHEGVRIFERGNFLKPPFPLLPDVVQVIFQDRNGVFWLGMRNGVARFADGALSVLGAKDGFPGGDVNVIAQSSDGDLWLGGSKGLLQFHEGAFRRWTQAQGMTSNNVWSLYPDSDGSLWVGTFDGGLMHLHNGSFTSYTTKNGLFNDGVFQILDDQQGFLWISCDEGIYRVSKRQMKELAEGKRRHISSLPFGVNDGLLDLEMNGGISPAGTRTRDGKLWFPSQDGVAIVDPVNFSRASQRLHVVIESGQVEQSPVSTTSEIVMPAGKDHLEIRYTAPSVDRPRQIRFRYQLQGLDSEWTDVGDQRVAFYTHLPPGHYSFLVSAANADGVWSDPADPLSVLVRAPFYRTSWFGAIVAVAVALLVAFAWRRRVSSLKQRQLRQLEFLKQLVSSQENERKRIAGELHDGLGQRLVAINAVAKLSLRARGDGVEEEQRGALEEISEEALEAIKDTQNMAYDLRPVHLDRFGLTKAVEILVKNMSTAAKIPIASDLDNVDSALPEAAHINVYRIVQEGLSNVAKYASATKASVQLKREQRTITLNIEDDGRGFEVKDGLNATGHVGLGLRGMSERAVLLGGEFKVTSTPGQGSLLTLTIRLDRDAVRRMTLGNNDDTFVA